MSKYGNQPDRPVIAKTYRRVLEAVAGGGGKPVDVGDALPDWSGRHNVTRRMVHRGWIVKVGEIPWEGGGTPSPLFKLTLRGRDALQLARSERDPSTLELELPDA